MFNYGFTQTTKIPAPEIKLIARAKAKSLPTYEIDAIIDTGATITCVPRELQEKLDIRDVDFAEVRSSLDGDTQYREVLRVYLRLAECEFEDSRVIIHERPYAIIGRDILNHYRITFDGINQRWEVKVKDSKVRGKTL